MAISTQHARGLGSPAVRNSDLTGTPSSPQRITRTLLVLFLTGICSRGYGFYNQQWKADPGLWTSVLQGTSDAPEQYRIGVVVAANFLDRLLGIRLSQAFGLLDLAGSILGALLLYRTLERSLAFRRASAAAQWFASAAFLALTLYYVDWTHWYQKVGTLPTAGLLAVMLWLWTPQTSAPAASQTGPGSAETPTRLRQIVIAVSFMLVAMLQAFVRADVSFMVCLGLLVASGSGLARNMALRRGATVAISLLTAAIVAAIQLYLMRIRYPHATYGNVPVFMLKHDYKKIFLWASCLIFLAPYLWTVMHAWRRRFTLAGAEMAFLLGSLGYLALWLVLGRLDEVRIFIPMALVTLPLTVELALARFGMVGESAVL